MRNKIYYYNIAAIGLFVTLLIGMGILFRLNSFVSQYRAVANRVDYIDQSFIKFTHLEFAFFHTKDIGYEKQFSDLVQTFHGVTRQPLEKKFFSFTVELPDDLSALLDRKSFSHFRAITTLTQEYILTIHKIFENQKRLGLDHNHGLYGKLRRKVHRLEARLKMYQNLVLLNSMLTMRRHEKDFMLRGLPGYVTKLHSEMSRFKEGLEASSYSDRKTLLSYADLYLKSFDSFVKYYNIVGYGEVHGLIQHSQIVRDSFSRSSQLLIAQLDSHIQPYENTINIMTVIVLVDAIILVVLIMLSRREIEHAKERNPITGLNGNNRIIEHLIKIASYKKKRTIIHFDFDYFKPFNDRFGFKNGDLAILEFARILKKQFKQKHNFIGHIGGDDFVAILYKSSFKEVLAAVNEIQGGFSRFCLDFYDPEDVARGYILQKDRFGETRQLPLLRVSVSIIQVAKHVRIVDPNDISMMLSALKNTAKQQSVVAVSLL